MAGIGAEGAYGAAGTFAGLQDWMRGQRQQVVQGQQDTLFQQGQEDRASAKTQELAAAKQKLLASQADAQQKEDYKARIKALGLPKLAELGALISIEQGKPLPNELLAMEKAKNPVAVETVGADGKPVTRYVNPEAGMELPKYVAPKEPTVDIAFAPDGTAYNRHDASLAGTTHVAPKAPPSEASVLAAEMARLRIQEEKQKLADAAKAKQGEAPNTFPSDLDAITSQIYSHPGMDSAGVGWNIGRSYNTQFGNLNAMAKQLRSLYLNDPDVKAKIAAMKPASNVDIDNALRAAVNFDPENMDAPSLRSELNRMRAKVGLKPLGTGGAAHNDLGKDW